MSDRLSKAELLDRMQSGYAAFQAVLSPLNEKQMLLPGVSGSWSMKDILAHITAWQRILLERLHAAAQNREPVVPGPGLTDGDVDRLNEQFYQENKARSLDELRTEFQATFQQVVEAVQALPENDLNDPARFSWLRAPLWQYIAGDTYEHYEEHIASIKEWLRGAG